jgi:hypothetical protein
MLVGEAVEGVQQVTKNPQNVQGIEKQLKQAFHTLPGDKINITVILSTADYAKVVILLLDNWHMRNWPKTCT